ncbi:MAG: HAD-IA family hydrolase [Acidobacteria bacterium]|nr:HAD-IA family hydrolase [Acidobacteriota bacterium]
MLFDLDGVLTATARLHAASWKRMFDRFLADREAAAAGAGSGGRAGSAGLETGAPAGGPAGARFRPFEDRDYTRYVDGRPRYDGVRAFLESRGITLPDGEPSDSPGDGTVCALGNRKNALFHELVATEGVETYDGSLAVVRHLRANGVRTAVVSSSRGCGEILDAAGIADRFELRVDGLTAEAEGLAGKPAPDMFVHAARAMGIPPDRAAVVEDAIAGVQAARGGGFGLVVAIDRTGAPTELAAAGADVVVNDLAETLG